MEAFGRIPGKHRQAFDKSLSLFHPDLDLRWKRSSERARLLLDGEEIWVGHPYTTEKWLQRYQNMPVADARNRDFSKLEGITSAVGHSKATGWSNTVRLIELLSICDKRVGWNILSTLLFTEPDPLLRRIIARRIYGAPTDK